MANFWPGLKKYQQSSRFFKVLRAKVHLAQNKVNNILKNTHGSQHAATDQLKLLLKPQSRATSFYISKVLKTF